MSRPRAASAMMRLFRSIGSVPGFALKGGLCAFLVFAPPRSFRLVLAAQDIGVLAVVGMFLAYRG